MTRTRVLVVDDAVVVRKIVTDALAEDPDIEVVGTAPNGKIALAKIPQVNPDVVTLDVEMPEMDGLATLTELRKLYPRLPVIMFSTLTERGAATTMEALLRGANDYVTKPANVGSVAEAQQRIKTDLLPRVHALSGKLRPGRSAAATAPRPAAPAAPRQPVGRPTTPTRIDAVVIGVSTGGPNALAELLPQLPADLPVPVMVVQHMPPMFTRLLAERLDNSCRLKVVEAGAHLPVAAGSILIAPGDHHLTVQRVGTMVRTALNDGPPENSCRPSVDVLFRTAAGVYGPHLLGVVLTGMGHDGKNGSEHIHVAGGRILAQDEATSVVWGMPGAVAAEGLTDEILPLSQIAESIRRRAQVGRTTADLANAATMAEGARR